jgi:hypothetical protein
MPSTSVNIHRNKLVYNSLIYHSSCDAVILTRPIVLRSCPIEVEVVRPGCLKIAFRPSSP